MSASAPDGVHDPVFVGLDGRLYVGVRRVAAIQQPAVGAEWAVNVPGGRMWRLVGGAAVLTTAAAVANRIPGIQAATQGVSVFLNANTTAITASTVQPVQYTNLQQYKPTGLVAGQQVVTFVPFWLQPGDTIGSATNALQAADQYSAINLYIEEMFTDATLMSEYHTEYVESAQLLARMAGGG